MGLSLSGNRQERRDYQLYAVAVPDSKISEAISWEGFEAARGMPA